MVKLLIVDDDEIRRRRFSTLAKQQGIAEEDITCAATFEEANTAIGKPGMHFDMAIVDTYLSEPPNYTDPEGWRVMKRLSEKPWNCNIIGLSGIFDPALEKGAKANGAYDYVHMEQGFTRLRELIAHHKSIIESRSIRPDR